jgi:hypothetical protein
MTKLESDLLHAIEAGRLAYDNATGGSEDWFIAEAVREVAKKYINKAMRDTGNYVLSELQMDSRFEKNWLKENGVI